VNGKFGNSNVVTIINIR